MTRTTIIKMSDGFNLSVKIWIPESSIRGMLYIVHGMVEHIARYDNFANFLNSQGILVFGDDHRGHGYSWKNETNVFYAKKNGWKRIILDMQEVLDKFKQEYNVPTFILGHSMGSYMTRDFIIEHADSLDGCILSGTGCPPLGLTLFGKALSMIRHLFNQNKYPDNLLNHIAFSTYNNKIEGAKTPFDWLSRDTTIVTNYQLDPMCGQIPTAGFWNDFFSGILKTTEKNAFKLSAPLPLFIFGGAMDPVGEYGKAIPKIAKSYQSTPNSDVTYKLYEGGRHEMLNELNKEEVYKDILHFIEMHNF